MLWSSISIVFGGYAVKLSCEPLIIMLTDKFNKNGRLIMEKRGFSRWAWLVMFLLGGLLMLYGGAQDLAIFFSPDLVPVSSWRAVPPVAGLICGLIVLASAVLNLIWGWQLRCAESVQERRLARRVALVSAVAMIADWICGYYGFGSLIVLLAVIWIMQ
jgi:hypothetical protein